MRFKDKIQKKEFWIAFLKIAVPFFIFLVIFSLILNSGKDILSGNFNVLMKENFYNNNWKSFFGYKVAFSIGYGLWLTNRKF